MAYAMTAPEGELAEGQERLAWAIYKGAGIPQSALRAASPLYKGAIASLVKGGGTAKNDPLQLGGFRV